MRDDTPADIDEWLLESRLRTERAISEHGVFIHYVGGDHESLATSFAYTIGMTEIGHPELVVLGVPAGTANGLLNEVASRVRAGESLGAGRVVRFDQWSHRVTVEVVPNPAQILFAANSYYGRPDESSVEAFQLTYDDTSGRFPWEDGYDVPAWIQPRPGEFMA